MDTLAMRTPNRADEQFQKLAALFPNAVTESLDENGEVVRAIDKDVLMQEIACKVVDGPEERYQFTWPDKKKSVLLSNAPIAKTLRPCRAESVHFDATENLYIEGDNLDVLKLLQETYLGKIKLIYIDPPYNTGNDFVYKDDFAQTLDRYKENSGQFDAGGKRLVQNTESNGRFHTDWLNMLYPRLRLAKDLLAEDGVIFISIDDSELYALKMIMDEIFSSNNFINNFMWIHGKGKKDNNSRTLQQYNLCFSKNKQLLPSWEDSKEAQGTMGNPDGDPRGDWFSGSISFDEARSNPKHKNYYSITSPSGKIWTRQWQISKDEMDVLLKEEKIYFGQQPLYNNTPRVKIFKGQSIKVIPDNILNNKGTTRSATTDLANLLGGNYFDNPKPVLLLQHFITIASNSDDTILDFFSGSATTAHAVMQLNAEDGGSRRFIMVQLPETCPAESEAARAGYQTICDIGKERIRRAGQKIRGELAERYAKAVKKQKNTQSSLTDADKTARPRAPEPLDIGFRVLKCDSSNMKDVYYSPAATKQEQLELLTDNVKSDRTPEDLLFQVMLELGVLLSSKIELTKLAGRQVFNVADGYLLACFDSNVSTKVITEAAKRQPSYFVMRDSSLASDAVAANFEQIFNACSPKTVRKVL